MNETPLIAGRYRITGLLGQGLFTDVYKAEDTVLGRKVALKVLKSEYARNPAVVARFNQDARASTELVHENFAHVLDVGSAVFDSAAAEQRPFVAMERVSGLSVAELLARGPLKPAEACRIADSVLSALDVAHHKGVVHQGISPSNVLLATTGSVKLSDAGLSAGIQAASGLGIPQDTVEWHAPEWSVAGPPDVRSDVFSVGVLLFAMLTGEVPFPGGYAGSRAVMASSLNERIPISLNLVVARALEPRPESRFASAAEFQAELREAAAGLPGGFSDVSSGLSSDEVPHLPVPPVVSAPNAVPPVSIPPVAVPPAPVTTAAQRPTSDDLPPTERMESVPPTTTDSLVMLFGRSAVSQGKEFEPSLPLKRRQRGRVVLGLVVSLVFVVAISMVTLWVLNIKPVDFFPSSARTVPSVVGFDYAKAAEAITKAGLTPVRIDEANAKVPLGAVIRVDPDANKEVDIGTRITVYVSSGLSEVVIPNLSGMTVEEATVALKKLGLDVGTRTQGNSATIAQGLIVTTTPAVGSTAKTGVKINLVISSGQVTIPDLTGMTIDAAAGILGGSTILLTPSLQADTSCRVGADGVVVTSQSVPPGDTPAGTPITLTYCAG